MGNSAVFTSATLTFHVHETENRDRVLENVSHQLLLQGEDFREIVLKGHYGNSIRRFTFHLLNESANRFAAHLVRSLSKGDRQMVTTELHECVDEHGSFYIRLDKQRLFDRNVTLSNADSVRVKLKLKFQHKSADTLAIYRRLLESSGG